MDAFERQPEPPRKRKKSTKKTDGEPTIAANLTPPPASAEELIQVSGAQNENTQPKARGPRKRKTLEQQATVAPPTAVTDQSVEHPLPVTPRANIGEAHHATLAAYQQAEPSAGAGAKVESAGVEKVASPGSAETNNEKKEAVSPGVRLFDMVIKGVSLLMNWFAFAVLSILFGFSSPVTNIPLLNFIKHYQLTTLMIVSGLGVLTLAVLLGWPLLYRRLRPVDMRLRAMSAVTGVSFLSSLLCLSSLAIALLRPPWCPTALCAAPRVVTKLITTTQGVHDANLDVYFVSFESAAFVVPGDPAHPAYIPSSEDPRSIGAVVPNVPKAATPYTIAIGLHSLYTGRYSIFIDKVSLLVTDVSRVSDPLHVYAPVVLTTYSSTNPSLFVYQGQQAGQVVADTYSTNPLPRVELRSGESDQIDAAIEARIPGDVQFIIQVTYHIATEQQRFTLTLNHTFEAVFAPASNWQKYQLNLAQNDFTPAPGK